MVAAGARRIASVQVRILGGGSAWPASGLAAPRPACWLGVLSACAWNPSCFASARSSISGRGTLVPAVIGTQHGCSRLCCGWEHDRAGGGVWKSKGSGLRVWGGVFQAESCTGLPVTVSLDQMGCRHCRSLPLVLAVALAYSHFSSPTFWSGLLQGRYCHAVQMLNKPHDGRRPAHYTLCKVWSPWACLPLPSGPPLNRCPLLCPRAAFELSSSSPSPSSSPSLSSSLTYSLDLGLADPSCLRQILPLLGISDIMLLTGAHEGAGNPRRSTSA